MHHQSNNAEFWYKHLPNGQRKTFLNREVIVSPGHHNNSVFVVEQGRARICLFGEVREQTLGYLKAGSVYVTHSPAWVEAMETTVIQSWPISQVKALFSTNPIMALLTIKNIGALLNNAIDLIESLAFRSVESRIAHYLITELHQQSSHTIRLIGNTDVLASLLGTSRQTASTIINKFEKSGYIERPDRERILIIRLDKLEEIANAMSAS